MNSVVISKINYKWETGTSQLVEAGLINPKYEGKLLAGGGFVGTKKIHNLSVITF